MRRNSLRSKINIAIFSAYFIVAVFLVGIYLRIESHLQDNRWNEVKLLLSSVFQQNRESLANDIFSVADFFGAYEESIKQRAGGINDVEGVEQVVIFRKNGEFLLASKYTGSGKDKKNEPFIDKDNFFSLKEKKDGGNIWPSEKRELANGPTLKEQEVNNKSYAVYSSEIQFLGEVYGYIRIYYSLKNLKDEHLLARVTLACSLIGILLVLLAVQNILLDRGVIKPAAVLQAAFNRIQDGKLGEQVFIEGRDEIGKIALAFNRMSKKLHRQHIQLSKNLESRIEKQMLTEEALQESQAKYRDIFENALEGIYRSTPAGKFMEANPSMARILGYESSVELLKKVTDIRKQLYVNSKKRDNVLKILQKDDAILNYDAELYKKDGSIICALLQIQGFRNKEGELLYLEGFMVDITERKRATKNELQQSRQKYRQLSEGIRDGYIVTAREGSFIHCNPSFCEMLGYSLQELKKLKYSQVRHPKHRGYEKKLLKDQLRKKGYTDAYEVEYIRKDGTAFPVEVRAYAIMDKQGNLKRVWGFIRDITDKKNLQAYKRSLQAEFISNARLASLGEMAAAVAHEINNPVNGVINYAQILINEAEKHSQETEILKRIIKEGDRIEKIVSSLLSFAREDKKERRETNLKEIIIESMELSRLLLKKDNIEVKLDIDSELPPISANPQQLEQVFVNILNNARHALKRKALESGEAKIFQITTELINKKGLAMVRVICYDNGVGIAPDILDRICEPFFSTKSEGAGTGLGLSISHGIIQEHKGELNFESVESKHTKVIVDLPSQA